MKRFSLTLIQVIVFLICIQLARALLSSALRWVAQPGGNAILFQTSNSLAFIIVGVALLVLFRPSRATLGLDLQSFAPGEQVTYWLGGLLVVALLGVSLLLDLRANFVNLHFVVVVPIFEELIFRGYVWSKIKNSLPDNSNALTLIVVTLLFALWHIGYLDSFLGNPLAMHGITLPFLLMTKMIIGIALGGIVGLVRWRSGKVLGPVLIHALWNLFA